jgi:hypothetical protein
MRAQLRPWKEVVSIFESKQKRSHSWVIYHSSNEKLLSGPHLNLYSHSWSEYVIDVKKDVNYGNRQLYTDVGNGNTYYDEWFVWIGEEPPIIKPLEDELWDISDW